MEDLYRENILDHYKHPKNRGRIPKPDASAHDSNPLCGDEISIFLSIKGSRIEDIKFEGSACAICIASASMLTEEAKGKTVKAAASISKGKVLSLLGIDPGPSRIKCALLPLKVLKLAAYKYLGENMQEQVL